MATQFRVTIERAVLLDSPLRQAANRDGFRGRPYETLLGRQASLVLALRALPSALLAGITSREARKPRLDRVVPAESSDAAGFRLRKRVTESEDSPTTRNSRECDRVRHRCDPFMGCRFSLILTQRGCIFSSEKDRYL